MRDVRYRDFQTKLMPTVEKDTVIGVRTPMLRRLAREMFKSGEYKDFLDKLPHKYYEENNLHAFIIEQITDYGECINELDRFLPYVDNWATCDSMSPRVFKSHQIQLLEQIKAWLDSKHIYTVRFAIKTLMSLYSREHFSKEHLEMVANVDAYDYYLRMAVAWYFATELAYNYDETLVYLEERRLQPWIHNKTIQKAIESYRVSKERKEHLRKLRR